MLFKKKKNVSDLIWDPDTRSQKHFEVNIGYTVKNKRRILNPKKGFINFINPS